MKLRPISDEEYSDADAVARIAGIPLGQCPTCLARNTEIPDSDGVMTFTNGTYRLDGEEYSCDCKTQKALRLHYLISAIPDQYMRFNWEEYEQPEVREHVATYLDAWENFRIHGFGMEFRGPLGVGKTAAATYVGKELVKRGQRVLFTTFKDVVGAFEKANSEAIEERMRNTTYLILDEVVPPYSDRSAPFYADKLETLVRYRTNFNLPTIITTNLSEDALNQHYPRIYSLLAPKQWRIEVNGQDARKSKVAVRNLEMILNGERNPIY